MARITAICQNLQLTWMNERNVRSGRAMIPLLKTVAGHPAPEGGAAGDAPTDPALVALAAAGASVPVSTALPALAFAPAGALHGHIR